MTSRPPTRTFIAVLLFIGPVFSGFWATMLAPSGTGGITVLRRFLNTKRILMHSYPYFTTRCRSSVNNDSRRSAVPWTVSEMLQVLSSGWLHCLSRIGSSLKVPISRHQSCGETDLDLSCTDRTRGLCDGSKKLGMQGALSASIVWGNENQIVFSGSVALCWP